MPRKSRVNVSSLPKSGKILRVVVDAFDLRGRVPETCSCRLRDRSTREYFEGHAVGHWCCRITAIAGALVSTKIVPQPAVLAEDEEDALFLLFLALALQANWWDRHVVPRASPSSARALIRLAVVDLALRSALLGVAAGVPEPLEGTPAWSQPKGRGAVLQELRDRIAPRPTYDDLAVELGRGSRTVSRSNLVELFTGKHRPAAYMLGNLARYFAKRIPKSTESEIAARLERHMGLSALAERLAGAFGWPFVEDLATMFVALTACSMRSLRAACATELSPAPVLPALATGILSGAARPFLDHVRSHASDPSWNDDLALAFDIVGVPVDATNLNEDWFMQRVLRDLVMNLPRRRSA